MSDPKIVPLTVLSSSSDTTHPAVRLGREGPTFSGDAKGAGSYWIVVLNLRTLEVVFNQATHEYDKAPDVSKYDTREHLLIVTTYCLGTGHVPQGAFYDFLYDNGGGRELKRIVQLNNTLGCGSWGSVKYGLIGLLGPGRPAIRSIEASDIEYRAHGLILTAQLVPITIDGETIYRPQALGD